jgi:hypothetical protein
VAKFYKMLTFYLYLSLYINYINLVVIYCVVYICIYSILLMFLCVIFSVSAHDLYAFISKLCDRNAVFIASGVWGCHLEGFTHLTLQPERSRVFLKMASPSPLDLMSFFITRRYSSVNKS